MDGAYARVTDLRLASRDGGLGGGVLCMEGRVGFNFKRGVELVR